MCQEIWATEGNSEAGVNMVHLFAETTTGLYSIQVALNGGTISISNLFSIGELGNRSIPVIVSQGGLRCNTGRATGHGRNDYLISTSDTDRQSVKKGPSTFLQAKKTHGFLDILYIGT
jgi:hypothetical protein